jgi:hypothetical protein
MDLQPEFGVDVVPLRTVLGTVMYADSVVRPDLATRT